MSPRRNWDSPNPFAAGECALPPGPKGGGAHPPAPKGVGGTGGVPIPTLEKKLSTLPSLLCGVPPLLRGEDRLAGRRGGWGVNILEDERNRIALLQ
jgi:hypothetical protein